MKKNFFSLLALSLIFFPTFAQKEFKHPGVLHTQEGIQRIYGAVQNEYYPAYESFIVLKEHKLSQLDYKMHGPFPIISRDGEHRGTKSKMEEDFSAAYMNALMWICTKDERHAEKALDILTAYANTLHTIPDTNDAPLLVGLEGFKIVYAIEALRYTYDKIISDQVEQVKNMLVNVFIPVMETFYSRPAYTNGNWGPIVTEAYMGCGIFLDNMEMYEKAKDFYLNANDNGTIRNYICGETGQIQESGRDQPHCMLGIGALATVCEIAWQQGDDLYSALDNRLLKGHEYVAKYNLGYDDVPFKTWKDITGKYCDWTEISEKGRGQVRPMWEMTYNHFVIRKGLEMPYTYEMVMKQRPEGYDRDHPGFGTLISYEGPVWKKGEVSVKGNN